MAFWKNRQLIISAYKFHDFLHLTFKLFCIFHKEKYKNQNTFYKQFPRLYLTDSKDWYLDKWLLVAAVLLPKLNFHIGRSRRVNKKIMYYGLGRILQKLLIRCISYRRLCAWFFYVELKTICQMLMFITRHCWIPN